MSKSNVEELIGILWFILALLLVEQGYKTLSIIALILGIICIICSIVYALIKEKNKGMRYLKGSG